MENATDMLMFLSGLVTTVIIFVIFSLLIRATEAFLKRFEWYRKSCEEEDERHRTEVTDLYNPFQ